MFIVLTLRWGGQQWGGGGKGWRGGGEGRGGEGALEIKLTLVNVQVSQHF